MLPLKSISLARKKKVQNKAINCHPPEDKDIRAHVTINLLIFGPRM